MVQGAISDWISYFETIATELGVDATVVENDQFQIRVNTDQPAVGKVRYSEFPNRKEDHIWQRYDTELERLNNSDERVFVIQLDIKSRSEYKLNRDHFIFIPHNLLKQETKNDGRIYINTDAPGQYEAPFNGYTDNWNALFEYITGDVYEPNLAEILKDSEITSSTNQNPPHSTTIKIGDEEYTITQEDVVQAFEKTKEPADHISHLVVVNGEAKGSKGVFRNIDKTPDSFYTRHSDTVFENLGFDIQIDDSEVQNLESSEESASSWRDTVREEIVRYHEENDTIEFQLQDFVEFSESTIRERFPNNQTWEASLRSTLQDLRDQNEIEFLGNGHYRINKQQFQSHFDDPTIFLMPGANEVSRTHFQDSAREGIPREMYQQFTDLDLGEIARVSGGFADYHEDLWEEVEPGDYMFFYRGDHQYADVAQVTAKEINREFAEWLWPDYVGETGPDEDRRGEYVHLVYLEDLQSIQLPRDDLHSVIDFDQDYPHNPTPLDQSAVEAINEEFGSIDQLIETYAKKPRVWVEKTQIENREYKQEGDLQLGNAIMAPSRDQGGRKRYEELREADVGDIVLHLLQEQHQFVGVSVIESELIEDFSGPPDNRWTEEQQEEGGYLRWLSDYEGIEPHIHVYDDLLENPEYEEDLRKIRENSEKIFYDKRLSLNQGHYFTQCPDELVEILTSESPHLRELLEDRGYQFDAPTPPKPFSPADEYGGIEEATDDISSRLDQEEGYIGWPVEGVAKGIIRDWTDVLRQISTIRGEYSSTARVKCEQIVTLYEEHADQFERIAEQIKSGTIKNSDLSPGEVLYVALFRELQELAGEDPNMNLVKFEKLLEGQHRGESTETLAPLDEPLTNIEEEKIERQLKKTGQLVFYGPPGTGKTYTAQRFARWWLNEQDGHTPSEMQLETVTFHPSFSYEDFIEGLTAEEKDGEVAYEIKDGVFKKISQRAKHAYEHARDSDEVDEPPRYVLIIDEINRGNLAQIFGETMTLLESDKRYDQENEVKISLAHSGDSFAVPPNLYVIGTMNTADRSIALVDAALRRRFRFISFPPNYKVIINDYDAFDSLDDVRSVAETDSDPYRSLIALSILALRGLNERIVDAPDLGKGKQIGHSYLMNLDDVDEVLDAWKYEILPLIEEYYFGQFDRIREELFDGSGDRLFHWEQEEIADFTADELRRTLAGLEEISLAEPETEASEDTQFTIELLQNEGILEPGTQLIFDESKVPEDADRPYDSSERFWRCEITGKTGQSDNIQWLHNDEVYSLSGLAQTILEQVSDHSGSVTGPDYWRHPEFENQLLAELRTDVQSGQLVVDEQTTD